MDVVRSHLGISHWPDYFLFLDYYSLRKWKNICGTNLKFYPACEKSHFSDFEMSDILFFLQFLFFSLFVTESYMSFDYL